MTRCGSSSNKLCLRNSEDCQSHRSPHSPSLIFLLPLPPLPFSSFHLLPLLLYFFSPRRQARRTDKDDFFQSKIMLSTLRRLLFGKGKADSKPWFDNLPVEVICMIADKLRPVDCAALALCSRATLHKLGSGVFDLNEEENYSILQRLERDGYAKDMILCSICRIFHPPVWEKGFGPKVYSPEQDAKPQTAQNRGRKAKPRRPRGRQIPKRRALKKKVDASRPCHDVFGPFPRHVAYDTVAAIMRCYRHNWATLPVWALNSTLYVVSGEAALRWNIDFKVVHGLLLARTTTILRPHPDASEGFRHVWRLREILENDKRIGFACAHVSWITVKGFFFYADSDEQDICRRQHRRCMWTNFGRCPSTPFMGGWDYTCICYPGPTTQISYIQRCEQCFTEICAFVTWVPQGSGRGEMGVLVLRSWKLLGRGVDTDDVHWTTHMPTPGVIENQEGGEDGLKSRNGGAGDISQQFELDGGGTLPRPYRASLSPWMYKGL